MSLYLDASALLTLYLDEPDSENVARIMSSDRRWLTAGHTLVEVRRNLARGLRGRDLSRARRRFSKDWEAMDVVELDLATCVVAASIAERTGARSVDALHLAAARRLEDESLMFVTYDRRQGESARSLGFSVVGSE